MLGPSLSLGSVAGIPIRIHWTFGLLLLWVLFSNFSLSGSIAVAFISLLFLMVIFGCVVLHELGHSLTAKRYGIATRSITLSPIGGIAALDSAARNWKQEFWITVAGPAVNAVIALITLPLVFLLAPISPILADPFTTVGNFVFMVFLANVVLVAFNLIPAFPMDGGRIFRALLASGGNRVRATRIAARVGQAFAVLMGIFGLFFSPFLAVIGVFVFLAAEAEKRSVMMEESLSGMTVHDAMRQSFDTVERWDTIDDVVRLSLRNGQSTFPVMSGGDLYGIVDLPRLIEARMVGRGSEPVDSIVDPDVTSLSPGDELMRALQAMQKAGRDTLPVTLGHRIVGLLPRNSILSLQAMRG